MKHNHRGVVAGVAFVLLALLFPIASNAATTMPLAGDVMQRLRAATVMVHIEYEKPYENRVSWGTGFVVGDGIIMTNAHVIEADRLPSRIYVHNEFLPVTEARIVAQRLDPNSDGSISSSYYDVALLSISPSVKLPVLPFSLNTRTNQDVFAFGFPGTNAPQYRQGTRTAPQTPMVVSGGRVLQEIPATPSLVMHDAYAAQGNSGGPVVNARGEVVGMQTWSADPNEFNIVESFAIGSRGLAGFMQSHGFQPAVRG